MTAAGDGVCGAVSSHPEGGSDCLCLDEHDVDRMHRCSTRGCEREWNDRPIQIADTKIIEWKEA